MGIDFKAVKQWRRSFDRRVGLVAGLALVGAAGLLALPGLSGTVPVPEMAACCTGATALGDTMINASGGGDKDFFEAPSSPPGAIFLLGNNESMLDYVEFLPEVGDTSKMGCSDPALVDAMKWFDRNSPDPKLNGSVPIDPDPEFSSTEKHFFDPDKFYHSRGRRLSWRRDDDPFSLDIDMRSTFGFTDTMQVCGNAVGWSEPWGSPVYAECQKCLADKGWWRGPMATLPADPSTGPLPVEARRRWILSGRVLNVNPPKFVAARKVLKDVIATVSGMRVGVATFGPDHGWFDPPVLLRPLKPGCDKVFPLMDESALAKPELYKAINSIAFRNDERSIGEALFGLGGYFSSQKVDGRWASWFSNPINPGWGWPGCCNGGTYDNPVNGQDGAPWGAQSPDEWLKDTQPWELGGQDRSVCVACQASSVIVLTDGSPRYDNSVPITKMMELLKARGARHPDGTPLTFDSSNPETNTNPGGVNYCDKFGATKEDCDYANWPTGLAKTNKNFMDDVAFFLANADLRGDLEGDQSVTTYTIGYGDNSPMLQSIAAAGKGRFFRANNADELRDAILAAIGEVKEISTSFSAANLSAVQAGGMQSSTYVPRFIPRRDRPYEGHLYRFFLYSEFTQGCEPSRAKSPAGDAHDLNGDKDCDDSFFMDRPAGFTTVPGALPDIASFTSANIVQENVDGAWVKVKTATVNSEGRLVGGTAAQPFWDLSETLGKRSASAPCDPNDPLNPTGGRCIFTLIDRDKDGRFTAADNPPVPFDLAHRAELKQYLLAAGDGFCAGAFSKLPKAWTGTAAQQEECVDLLIGFVRGADVFDYDGDLNTSEDRPCSDDVSRSCKLADIFHSSPVTVDPPVEPLLCSLGLSGQCLSTLYEDFTASVSSETPCTTPAAGKPCYAATPMNPPRGSIPNRYGAYDVFRQAYAGRERIVLVGSNGGMLHAVHAGASISSRQKKNAFDDAHDLGTGQELWAFIPPDLLPKLGLMMNGHEFYVDGTAMVRDLWADGSAGSAANDVKEADEFHSVAILTERSGGQRFVALDVTNPREMLKPDGKPFRWMFPNACDPESSAMGQSWANFAPKPPPMGPVRLAKNNSRGWEERWIAMLNGGYSADLARGRGVYMLDAWTGRKLWSFTDEVQHRMMPIAAAPALVDIGRAEDLRMDLDGFFDTMVVGDLGGQVWTFRFHEPGVLGSDGLVQNWFGARSLEMARDGKAHQKQPFFHLASTVRQPETGWLRAFLGTGERQHLRSKEGTNCGPDDLLACVRMKCDVEAELTADLNGQLRKYAIEYDDGVLVKNTGSLSGTVGATCSSSRMELTHLRIQCDKSTALGNGSYRFPASGPAASTDAECSKAGGEWSCALTQLPTDSHGDLELGADVSKVPHNRYFGFHAYGGSQRRFRDAAEALAFDDMRVTEGSSLVDVTIPDNAYQTYVHPTQGPVRYVPTSALASLPRGTAEGAGWFMRYGGPQEKTAAGSAVLGGIVFWPSFSPPTSTLVSACRLVGSGDLSRSWQADVITGLPDQSAGFQLVDADGNPLGFMPSKTRDAWAPPPEPAAVVSVSPSGGVRYEVVMPGVGASPVTETLRERQNTTPDISWLEVPRNLHVCRHENAQACLE
ncbi:pilus assembly protein [Archangium lipolyticum]|uniref:PilC/PilY family type IV pilus protein n=1 Tax=Archangium lipolyticum TaxID=2970465 RepID=UPI00214A3205|nr:PilC/PilY family type IV pilus protein [Archangium lipolyticum]